MKNDYIIFPQGNAVVRYLAKSVGTNDLNLIINDSKGNIVSWVETTSEQELEDIQRKVVDYITNNKIKGNLDLRPASKEEDEA